MEDINLVEVWLKRDTTRWIAGAMAGIVGAVLAVIISMLIARAAGMESWFPLKLIATLFLGSFATESGMHSQAIVTGAVIFGVFGIVFGMIYAHFAFTNMISGLLGMGLVWAIFSWIFIWNLFLQSFNTINAARIPPGPIFPICLAFGFGLTSVAFFDRLLRGK